LFFFLLATLSSVLFWFISPCARVIRQYFDTIGDKRASVL